jgi:hypothetical protein
MKKIFSLFLLILIFLSISSLVFIPLAYRKAIDTSKTIEKFSHTTNYISAFKYGAVSNTTTTAGLRSKSISHLNLPINAILLADVGAYVNTNNPLYIFDEIPYYPSDNQLIISIHNDTLEIQIDLFNYQQSYITLTSFVYYPVGTKLRTRIDLGSIQTTIASITPTIDGYTYTTSAFNDYYYSSSDLCSVTIINEILLDVYYIELKYINIESPGVGSVLVYNPLLKNTAKVYVKKVTFYQIDDIYAILTSDNILLYELVNK